MVGKKSFVILLVFSVLFSFSVVSTCITDEDCSGYACGSINNCATSCSYYLIENEHTTSATYCDDEGLTVYACDTNDECTIDSDADGVADIDQDLNSCSTDDDCDPDSACYSADYCITCVDEDGYDPYTQDTNVAGVDESSQSAKYEISAGACYGSSATYEYTCIIEEGDSGVDHTFVDVNTIDCLSGPCANGACNGSAGCSTSSTSCVEGYLCDTDMSSGTYDTCVAYCGFTETECNDGVDNDGNGVADYFGSCELSDGTFINCFDTFETWYTDILGNDSSDGDQYLSGEDYVYYLIDIAGIETIPNYCSDVCLGEDLVDGIDGLGGTYYSSDDSHCVSPLDPYEGTGTGTYAPEVASEEGFFARIWNWIIFWN
ncbi:hypothetical protein EXS74_03085 [Candidatus Woesearchaeota archaeon]|nr:hypothetical protein [Candidatus Woesearchaeota archaeon]